MGTSLMFDGDGRSISSAVFYLQKRVRSHWRPRCKGLTPFSQEASSFIVCMRLQRSTVYLCSILLQVVKARIKATYLSMSDEVMGFRVVSSVWHDVSNPEKGKMLIWLSFFTKPWFCILWTKSLMDDAWLDLKAEIPKGCWISYRCRASRLWVLCSDDIDYW